MIENEQGRHLYALCSEFAVVPLTSGTSSAMRSLVVLLHSAVHGCETRLPY